MREKVRSARRVRSEEPRMEGLPDQWVVEGDMLDGRWKGKRREGRRGWVGEDAWMRGRGRVIALGMISALRWGLGGRLVRSKYVMYDSIKSVRIASDDEQNHQHGKRCVGRMLGSQSVLVRCSDVVASSRSF
jgi:hypothetical protein